MINRILVSTVLFMFATTANAFETGVYLCNDNGIFEDGDLYISFRLNDTSLEILDDNESLELVSWTEDTLNTWIEVTDSTFEDEKDKYKINKDDNAFKIEFITEYTEDLEIKRESSSSVLTKNSNDENYTVTLVDKTFDHKGELIESEIDSIVCKKSK